MKQRFANPQRRRWIFFPLLIIAGMALMGYVVMWLWNAILPAISGLSSVTFPQALGILLLSRILFGGFRFGNRFQKNRPPFVNKRMKEKFMSMNEEERAQFKQHWNDRCGRH